MIVPKKTPMRNPALVALWMVTVALAVSTTSREASAMPNFARKLGVSCSTCHTSPPRLNETGYKFRAAGYRMPGEIGKGDDKPFSFFDYNAVRLQARYDASRSRTGPDAKHSNEINLFATEFYLMTGEWGKHLSSNLKVTYYPEKSYDTEDHLRVEGNLKLTYGNEKRFYEIRAGVPHPMEGFGASDTLIANTRPFFQERAANLNQSTFFTPWNFHQAATTFGYYQGRTAIRAYLLEGVRLHDSDDELSPFGRKEPFTKDLPLSKHGAPDFQLFVIRILHHDGGGVSMYYYHGNLTLPVLDDKGKPAPDKSFQNHFDRLAFYGSYPVAKRLTLLSGVQRGWDETVTGGKFASLGAYVEGAIPINDLTHAGVRFDWFDPARSKSKNEVRGFTTYLNLWLQNQYRIVAEYQHKNIKQGSLLDRKDNAFQLRLIFIR